MYSNTSDNDLSNSEIVKILKVYISEQIEQLKISVQESITSNLDVLREKIENLEKDHRHLNNKIEFLDRKVRKNNILIFGVKEDNDKSVFEVVSAIFDEKLNIKLSIDCIANIYRIGKFKDNSFKRPIIIQFTSFLKKSEVIKRRRYLKGTNIFISDDLTETERAEKRVLNKHLKNAKDKNLNAYLKNNSIVVNGEVFTAQDLQKSSVNDTGELDTVHKTTEGVNENTVQQLIEKTVVHEVLDSPIQPIPHFSATIINKLGTISPVNVNISANVKQPVTNSTTTKPANSLSMKTSTPTLATKKQDSTQERTKIGSVGEGVQTRNKIKGKN